VPLGDIDATSGERQFFEAYAIIAPRRSLNYSNPTSDPLVRHNYTGEQCRKRSLLKVKGINREP
jgi:hypothetical protein